jgi:hypothetical protein
LTKELTVMRNEMLEETSRIEIEQQANDLV